MKLLIVHDRPEAAEQIRSVVQGVSREAVTDVAEDVLAAIDLLRKNFYDLAIVDLTLPIRMGGHEPALPHAEFLLEQIFGGGGIHTPSDILGITKEDGALELVRNKIGQHLMGCIREDGEGSWKQQLAARLRYVENARRARLAVANSTHDHHLVIMTALDKEAAPYRDLFELRDPEGFAGARPFNFRSYEGTLRRGIIFSVGTSGQAPTASAAQALITYYRPKLILMTGFCGGVRKRTAAGDLIAFRSSYAWDYGKWEDVKLDQNQTTSRFRARPTPLNADERGADRAIRDMLGKDYRPGDETIGQVAKLTKGKLSQWDIKRGAAASGSAVVTSLDIVDQILGLDENIRAIEMESYGFYYACRNTPVIRPDFICLKSVADFCNGAKNSKLHAACSLISAAFAKDFVTKHYKFDDPEQ